MKVIHTLKQQKKEKERLEKASNGSKSFSA
jgi:hypothetical protein